MIAVEIRYGSNYKDKKGNIYRFVGNAKPMGKGDKVLLFAPVHAGTVGDVVYVNAKDAAFEPVSKYF